MEVVTLSGGTGRAEAAEQGGRVHMSVNHVTLNGEKRGGLWYWTCPSLPGTAEAYSGLDDMQPMLDAFFAYALTK